MPDIKVKPELSKSAKLISLIMILLIGVISNYIYVLAVYVEPLNEMHGWSMNSIVMAYSVAMFCEFPAFIAGGWLMNRFGMRKVLIVCGTLYGLAILFSGLTSSVIVFVICQGIIGSLAMYGLFICTLAIINAMFPNNNGLVMGILYGTQAAGGAAMAPIANVFITHFNVSMALVWQGVIFTIIMFVCCLLIVDPTKGDKEALARAQEEAEAEEAAEAVAGKTEDQLPSMGWKKALTHPAFWVLFISIICIQMIGNLLITDISALAKSQYGVTAATAALLVSAFSIGAGVGGVVIGFISDRIGPYRTTFWMGIIDGVLLLILAIAGQGSFMAFAVVCVIQGFTYNGMTALNPIMMTDSYAAKDIGTTMGFMGISYMIVAVLGPQLGFSVPFVPMLIICGALCIIGGFISKLACSLLNKYYKSIGSKCIVR